MVTAAASAIQSAQAGEKGAAAAKIQAQRISTAKQFSATQARVNAGQEIASSQRAMLEERRQTEVLESRQTALAAASGGSASDPTVVNLIARTAGRGAYKEAVQLYGGEEKARQLRMQASGLEYEAAAAIEAGDLQAEALQQQGAAGVLKAGGGLLSKYGGSIFPTSTASGDSAVVGSGGYNTGKFGGADVGGVGAQPY